jgi:hypothetical protein
MNVSFFLSLLRNCFVVWLTAKRFPFLTSFIFDRSHILFIQSAMETLVPDLVAFLCSQLSVGEIVALSSTCQNLRKKINSNASLWCSLCVKLLGHTAPETRKQLTVNIGLAEKVLSWREFFISTYASSVFTWGDGSRGRCGHPLEYYSEMFKKPKELVSLTGQGIDFVGKTAEMGSVALAFGGTKAFVTLLLLFFLFFYVVFFLQRFGACMRGRYVR